MMKRFFLSCAILFLLWGAYAQKYSLTKAYDFFYEKDFVQAKNMIDQCAIDEKLSQKANTWLYKGNIYFYLANDEYEKKRKNDTYNIQYPNAPMESYNAFVKAKEMNKNCEAYGMFSPDEALGKIYPLLLFQGVNLLMINKPENIDSAKQVMEYAAACYEMFTPPAFPMNGELYYYYAVTLEMLNDIDNACVYYEKAIRDNSQNLNVYLRLIDNYKKKENVAKVKEIIDLGNINFPNDASFYVAQIDYYNMIGDSIATDKMLLDIPQSVYANPDLMVNLANFFIEKKNYDKAIELLNKSDRITPNNFVIGYNLGVCYYYLSEENFNRANEENLKGNTQTAQQWMTKSQEFLDNAQYRFEKVLQTEPDDLNVLKTLKSIYIRQKYPKSKYEDLNNKINNLENNK